MDFDIGSLIPSLESLLERLDLLLRILVMAGPLGLLGLGLYYFLLPPKEANYSAGYRFSYGMKKVKVWRFMQRIAGMVYSGVGLVLTIVMALICIGFGDMAAPDMLWAAVKCILWELGIVVLATLGINITVMAVYDSEGNSRAEMRELFPKERK
jgi:uncharacterized membrane protein